jgi:predicted RNA-binding Zn ribbon-like protein
MVTPGTPSTSETGPYAFDLSGGRLCLDFANTVSDRGSDAPVDHLRSYADLAAWAGQSGAAPAAVARELARQAAAHPSAARAALADAIALREALYRIFAAAATDRKPRPADLALLNAQVPAAYARSHLVAAGGGFAMKVEAAAGDLLSPLAPVVKSAVDLVTSDGLHRVRTCAADTCEWLFIDTTKNRTRRWCDMKVCGNRAKVRRFRSRA